MASSCSSDIRTGRSSLHSAVLARWSSATMKSSTAYAEKIFRRNFRRSNMREAVRRDRDSAISCTRAPGRFSNAARRRGNLTTYKGHPAASGTMMDWMKETHQAGIDTAYDGLSNGDDLAGVYIEHALPVVQQQLLNAGIRLAKSSTRIFRSELTQTRSQIGTKR